MNKFLKLIFMILYLSSMRCSYGKSMINKSEQKNENKYLILLDLPMPIITPRMILRPPQPGDGVVVNKAIFESFEALHEYMPFAKDMPTVEETEMFVRQAAANWILKEEKEPYLPIFMFDCITKEFIGSTGYLNIKWEIPVLEIGYWIKTSYSSKGLMTEAVNALTRYAFEYFHANRVTITCDSSNVKSKRISERLGFCFEGTLKNARLTVDGKLSDTLVYARYNIAGLPEL